MKLQIKNNIYINLLKKTNQMKIKTTKSAIKQGFYTVISIGYCDLQNLLNYVSPFAYSAGINGWACDYYEIGNVCISTGYSPIGQSVNSDLIREYDTKAEKIKFNNSLDYSEKKVQVTYLLNEFIEKATIINK